MGEDIAVKVAEIDQRAKSNTHRIDKVDLDKLVSSVAMLANEQERIKDDVTEIKTDVKTLTERPAKRWDGIVDKLIWAVLAAVLGFVLAQIGIT